MVPLSNPAAAIAAIESGCATEIMVYEGIFREDSCDRVAAAVTDAHWFEIDADFEAAIRHFRLAVSLYQSFDARGGSFARQTAGDHQRAVGPSSH